MKAHIAKTAKEAHIQYLYHNFDSNCYAYPQTLKNLGKECRKSLEGVPKKGVLRGSGGVKRDAGKGMLKKGCRKKGRRKKGMLKKSFGTPF